MIRRAAPQRNMTTTTVSSVCKETLVSEYVIMSGGVVILPSMSRTQASVALVVKHGLNAFMAIARLEE